MQAARACCLGCLRRRHWRPRRQRATTMADKNKPKPKSDGHKLGRADYEARLEQLQVELNQLARWLQHTGKRLLVLIEGRDTAGKGGVISAIADALPPRAVQDRGAAQAERARKHAVVLPALRAAPAGRRRDRAVRPQLVQPRRRRDGDGLLQRADTARFLRQVPVFEKLLVDDGVLLFKYWLTRRPGAAGGAFRRAAERPAQALEAVAGGPAGARQVRGLRPGARPHAAGHAQAATRHGRWSISTTSGAAG